MRILAIRGRNLASLTGDFEIRLDAPPLADAGLFAITGRTGAGKSTILDALCLALFDRMPRLPGGRGVEVGHADEAPEARLRNNDVRSVLRRGTGEGYAEADFRGVDKRRYRARWSVRRARLRAGGRFQAQTMALADLDTGENLSGTKTEVLDAIQTRLGLTFEQFRRSVLLAQGDFAAFLRADAGERAELLERVTGTGIYGELSQAVHRRAAEENKCLELIRHRLGDQQPLDAGARAVLEVDLAASQRNRDEQLLAQQGLEQAQRWYQTLDKLVAERDQAAERLSRAQAERDAADPRHQTLERTRALQPLRLPLRILDQAVGALDQARRELEQARAEDRERQLEGEGAAAVAACAEVAFAEAQEASEDAAPALREARRLDTRLQDARAQFQLATTEQGLAQLTLRAVKEEQAGLEARSAQAMQVRERTEGWLAEHAGLTPLAAQWEAWERELERYARARGVLERARVDIDSAEREGVVLGRQRRGLESNIDQTSADRARVATERTRLETQVAAFDLGRLAKQREGWLARRGRVEHWRQLAERARDSLECLDGLRNRLGEEQTRRSKSDARLKELEAGMGPLASALTEAEAAHHRLVLASAGEVETLRAQLQAGQPCPVCGAEQHPWADRAEAFLAGLAGEQAVRVAGLRRQTEETTAEQARKRALSEQAMRRCAELASEIDVQQARLERTLGDWSACEADSLRPADPLVDGLDERMMEELESLDLSLQQIAGEEAKARALQSEVNAMIAEIEGLDSRRDVEKMSLAVLDEQIRAISETRKQAELNLARAGETMDQVSNLVAEPLGGIADWRGRLEATPEALRDSCRHQVEAWRLRVGQRDEASQSLHDLAPRLAREQTRRQAAEKELEGCTDALRQQSSALAALKRDRAALLNGRPADLVESELEAAVTGARQQLEQARSRLARARETSNAAQGVLATRGQALQEREASAARARRDLDEQMACQGAVLDELRETLKRDQDWIERERLALQGLLDIRHQAQALLEERERLVEEHQATDPPGASRNGISERLPLAMDSVKAAHEHWARLHGQIAEDERRCAASRAIRAELDQQQAAWALWESLRELIGSADGAKFRNFAQGLTLDVLVAHANYHLRELARRYELQRVPDAEMEIQVIDREMGDEVRSIHSLSGGESFLASLALALGLASLASDRVEVESLFVDEGFGALDTESLDLAIASLDALYGLGRQVGVISHVGTLVERIGVQVQVTKLSGGRSRLHVVCD